MKILLGDDHKLFSEGFSALLRSVRPNFVVTSTYSGIDLLEKIQTTPFDLVLLDLRIPGIDGFGILEQLQSSSSFIPIVILTASENPLDAERACQLGARGFISKKCSGQQIIAIIDRVMQGELVFPDSLTTSQVGGNDNWQRMHQVTPRQLQVLRLIRAGFSNKAIAAQLSISETTVKTHVAAVIKAFDATNRSEAVSRAELLGLD